MIVILDDIVFLLLISYICKAALPTVAVIKSKNQMEENQCVSGDEGVLYTKKAFSLKSQ